MEKDFIENKLRESLFDRIKKSAKKRVPEASSKPVEGKPKEKSEEVEDKEYDELSSEQKKQLQTQTIEIRQAVGPGKSLKISQAIEDANLGDADDAAARGKYTQKIFGRNDRHLTPAEAAALSRVTKNPNAYN